MSDSEQSNASEGTGGSDAESVNSGSRFEIFLFRLYLINSLPTSNLRSRSASRSRSRSGSDSDAAARRPAPSTKKSPKKKGSKKRPLDEEEVEDEQVA